MNATLIKNARIYDGSGMPPFQGDLLMEDGKITRIAREIPPEGYPVVDAGGLALSPGFINTHSHMELEIFKNPQLDASIRQGITTEVLGQDGSSVTPVTEPILQELAENMAPLAGQLDRPYWWRSFADYMDAVEQADPAVRFVSLVGHGTLRMCVMGSENRDPTPAELEGMKQLLAQCMEQGAKGLSFGLIYPPGSYGKTEELTELAKVVAAYDGLIMVHMRNEKARLLESIEEMLTVMQGSGARLQISHFKSLGPPNWGLVKKGLARLEALRAQGYDVTFDQYPWTAACTGLKVCAPQWAFSGGEEAFQKRLKNPEEYEKIRKETADEVTVRGGGDCIMIASVATEEYGWMAGHYMTEIAEKLGMEVPQAILHILQHEGPAVIAIYFSIGEEDVTYLMKSPLQCICTDGIVGAHPHPRTYASFPRFLGHYVRDLGCMRLEEAIHKITMEPARRLRLWDRGILREGLSADLVLFDPAVIADVNSYLEPAIPPVGIAKVWVQGRLRFSAD